MAPKSPENQSRGQDIMEQRADISPEMNESSENRQERLAQLSGDAFLQEAWGIEKRQQMSQIPASKILEQPPYVLQRTFLRDENGEMLSHGDAMSLNSPDSCIGRRFTVNFLGNSNAERHIGAGNCLPFALRCVEITAPGESPRIGVRKTSPRVGYYDDRGYVRIYSKYTIEIKGQDVLSDLKSQATPDSTWSKELESYLLDPPEGIEEEEALSHQAYLERVRRLEKEEVISQFMIVTWREAINVQGAVDHVEDLQGLIQTYIDLFDGSDIRDLGMGEDEIESHVARVRAFAEALPSGLSAESAERIIGFIEKGYLAPHLFSEQMAETLKDSEAHEYMDSEALMLLGTSEGRVFEPYVSSLKDAAVLYGIPVKVMIHLMVIEGSRGNPRAKAPGGSATGLGQMIDQTWEAYKPPIAINPEDRYVPEYQIMAMAHYLKVLRDEKNSTWLDAICYYHTGSGGVTAVNLEEYKTHNPGIAAMMVEDTPEAYWDVVQSRYDSDLINLDF